MPFRSTSPTIRSPRVSSASDAELLRLSVHLAAVRDTRRPSRGRARPSSRPRPTRPPAASRAPTITLHSCTRARRSRRRACGRCERARRRRRGSSGGGSRRSIAAGSVRQQTVRIETSRNCIGNGGTSGASHGNENGPSTTVSGSSAVVRRGAPRQLLRHARYLVDCVPVQVEPEPGPIRHDGAAVANLELRRRAARRARRGRSPVPCTRARPGAGSRARRRSARGRAGGRAWRPRARARTPGCRGHELAHASDHRRVAAHDVDRAGVSISSRNARCPRGSRRARSACRCGGAARRRAAPGVSENGSST